MPMVDASDVVEVGVLEERGTIAVRYWSQSAFLG